MAPRPRSQPGVSRQRAAAYGLGQEAGLAEGLAAGWPPGDGVIPPLGVENWVRF